MLIALLIGCADITPIDDDFSHGRVEVVQDWFTSVARVETTAGTVLVDSGFRPGVVDRKLARLGDEPEDIIAVLVTHGDGDHVGGLDRFPNAEIIGHPDDQDLISEESDARLTQELDGDEVLTFGDTTVTALWTPGHTEGSMVYVIDDMALIGDVGLFNRDGELVNAPEKRNDDQDGAEASLAAMVDRLRDWPTEIAWVIPSHSGAGPLP